MSGYQGWGAIAGPERKSREIVMSRVVHRSLGVVAAAALLLPALASAEGTPALAPDVVKVQADDVAVEHPAKRVVDVRARQVGGATQVDVVADGELGRWELTELKDPPRLALDLLGVAKAPRAEKALSGPYLRTARFGKHEDRIRVVLDGVAAAAMPAYRIERTATGLRLWVGEEPVADASAPESKPASEAAKAKVIDVSFRPVGDAQLVEVALAGDVTPEVSRPEPGVAVMTFSGAELPAALQRSLDTSAFGGPVRTVSSFVDPSDGSVRIVAALSGQAKDRVAVENGKLRWTFEGAPVAEARSETRAAGFRSAAPAAALETAAGATKYQGRRVSFEFKDIDLHNLLRVIAEVSKRNIVVSDEVKGKITIRLRNVPWDQALDLILKTKGLGKEETGNIIRIAPLKVLEEEAKARAAAAAEREKELPLKVRIIPVNYAMAKELEPKVKDLLTKRGTITVDQRTNTLVVKDIVEVLSKAEGLVRSLDTQTPQVLISSRIVEASSNFSRDIGIQWGGSLQATSATGNPTGLAFPSNVASSGAVPGAYGGGYGVPAQPNWAVSLPANIADNEGAGLGMHFGSAGGSALLNLRITALEKQGVLKTVSAPRVTTLDNKEAVISQGVSIPFSQVSAAGVNTVFVEAKLELKVVPHVTADGAVLMQIKATNNQPNPQLTGANGQPSITKREAETEVLVQDGDTTVIGGIYTRKTSDGEAKVPLFGDIPILGWLFKNKTVTDERTELLIFISPSIVNREASVVAGG
jgi:type IV pilus assembly protein PilQ